jgi:ATP-binding protein involved in chromosome partitioning
MAQPPNPFEQQRPIPGITSIVAVASGKGGVGKSTVAANLALSAQMNGLKVGLLDADIYGPSVPRLFGTLQQKPEVDENRKILPIQRYGLKLMSMGYLIEENLAVVWRGPMLFKAMDQMLRDVNWGELDLLVVDLPPGTGDVQLSLAQKVPLAGAVLVSTPQNVALMDVKKSIDMFERVGVPILGLVENMAYFVAPGSTDKVQLFPKGELDAYLQSKKIPKLGQIPFETAVAIGCEAGIPVVESHSTSASAQEFKTIASQVLNLATAKN